LVSPTSAQETEHQLKVRMSWGHENRVVVPYFFKLVPAAPGLEIRDVQTASLEPGEQLTGDTLKTTAGGGDIDSLSFTLVFRDRSAERLQNLQTIWADLIKQSDADTAARLLGDAAFRPNSARLSVLMNPEGVRGFSVSVDQLRERKSLWIPSLDVYLDSGDAPVSFDGHQKALAPWKGGRVLDRVRQEPEATYALYKSRWEDMGNPGYSNPFQQGPGHVVCLSWDSSIAKFEIDRAAGVSNDLGNPDRFQFWFGFGDLSQGVARTWKSQRLEQGLPVIATVIEKDRVRYEVEQFAYPLHGPPRERRGDIPMVLMQKVKATNLEPVARRIPIAMSHRRELPAFFDSTIVAEVNEKRTAFVDKAHHRALLTIDGAAQVDWHGTREDQRKSKRLDLLAFADLPANGAREFVVKLPSAPVGREDAATLDALRFDAARAATIDFWTAVLARGAQFRVPEEAVNDLYRASLWHALRLPRRHGAAEPKVTIDLPYSNSAYGQTGAPWPVNQAVYVDYMLYDLRGYPEISAEELRAQYKHNLEAGGHVSGYANWVVYTPSMLYATAKHYLLTHDRRSLETLLPQSLKALDWCLAEIREAGERQGAGLVTGPLNDITGEGVWAFNQAYLFAGLDLFGQALADIGHPRSAEALAAARSLRQAIEKGFGTAAARSPLVELRDHTWTPYVPGEATTPGRLLSQWYPTDVDTGPLHLLRLGALPARGELAESLLNDHEDNLFLKGWGMANEPVYNQQATAYLLRDEPKAAIRAFYSYMACAFSHSTYEPVEHRWSHGQFFGPPSTSGAWFELYRQMLIHETDDQNLLLAQAAPRVWLEDGKKIEVRLAPTYFDQVSYTIDSKVATGSITAAVEFHGARRPRSLLLRLRHPQEKPLREVVVNGRSWKDFDAAREWIRIDAPAAAKYEVIARY
jgi:hypothetical protein